MNSNKEHKITVGPVHAGVIEPGVFRFVLLGNRVESLDVELGFQHRGIEKLIIGAQQNPLKMICLAEQIAGDTTIGHTLAMAKILEQNQSTEIIELEREVALEIERTAMNLSDIAGISADIAFQTTKVAAEAQRTQCVNTLMRLCGNRYGRGLIRPGGSNFRIDLQRCTDITQTFEKVGRRTRAISRSLLSSPSVLGRLEEVCATDSPLAGRYTGDLKQRLTTRFTEIKKSVGIITRNCKTLAGLWFEVHNKPNYNTPLPPNQTITAEVNGWRGKITHTATIDQNGKITQYNIEDPSQKLWEVLRQTAVGADVADFPVNNKSFNLSYCATDK